MTCSLLCVNRGRGLRQHNIFDVSAVTVAARQQGQSAVPGLKPQDHIRRVVIILQLAPDKTCLTRMQSRRRTEYRYYMRAKSSVTVRIETLALLSTIAMLLPCIVLLIQSRFLSPIMVSGMPSSSRYVCAANNQRRDRTMIAPTDRLQHGTVRAARRLMCTAANMSAGQVPRSCLHKTHGREEELTLCNNKKRKSANIKQQQTNMTLDSNFLKSHNGPVDWKNR